MYKGKRTDGAPTYINIGDGGNREGPCPNYYPQPDYSAYREAQFGHGSVDALNSTHLAWTWHRVRGLHVAFVGHRGWLAHTINPPPPPPAEYRRRAGARAFMAVAPPLDPPRHC